MMEEWMEECRKKENKPSFLKKLGLFSQMQKFLEDFPSKGV
jgi:hypothetical protein